jgi:hypothetical protein
MAIFFTYKLGIEMSRQLKLNNTAIKIEKIENKNRQRLPT